MILISIAIVIVTLVIWRVSTTNSHLEKIPGPPSAYPFIGNYFEFIDFDGMYHNWVAQYGPTVRYYFMMNYRVLVTDPADVKKIFNNSHLFNKAMPSTKLVSRVLGQGLVTQTDTAIHKYHRSIITPAFSLNHLKALVPIFQRKGAILTEDWVANADKGVSIPIKDDISKTTSDVIGEAAFGYQLGSQQGNSPSSVYSIMTDFFANISSWELIPVVKFILPSRYRLNRTKAMLDQKVNTIIQQKIGEREGRPGNAEEGERDDGKQRDLLDVMLDCQNEDGTKLTQEELADQVKTFLIAGYDTSSVCILWTMYMLAKNQDVQQKVANEVLSVIGQDKIPTAEDVEKMPYLNNVVKESLRIRPPIPHILRNVAEDTTLSGYHIPKGTSVAINAFVIHHNPLVWENPEKFDPERWNSEDKYPVGSYIPFGMGPRNCIGSRFALLEIKVIMAMILQKLQFTPGIGPEPKCTWNIALVPTIPINLFFSKRQTK